MALAHPWTLLLGLLAVVVVWLYRRPQPVARLQTGLGPLWQEALQADPWRLKWQRWRGPASLAVQLLVLALVVVALADPHVPPPQRTVLIVDNSPSMQARDWQPSRLEHARRLARAMVGQLRPSDRLGVITAADGVKVCCTPSADPRLLAQAIDSIQPGGAVPDLSRAVAVAREMLAPHGGGRIVVITDGCPPQAVESTREAEVEMVLLGRPSDNLAITHLAADVAEESDRSSAGDLEAGDYEVLVEVANFSDHSARCRLTFESDSGTLACQPGVPLEIDLKPDARVHRVFRLQAPAGTRLKARVETVGSFEDMLPEDDVRSLVLESSRAAAADTGSQGAANGSPSVPAGPIHSGIESGDWVTRAARELLAYEAGAGESDLRRTALSLPNKETRSGSKPLQPAGARRPPPDGRKLSLAQTPGDAERLIAGLAGGLSLRSPLMVAALVLAVVQWCLEQRRWLA